MDKKLCEPDYADDPVSLFERAERKLDRLGMDVVPVTQPDNSKRGLTVTYSSIYLRSCSFEE